MRILDVLFVLFFGRTVHAEKFFNRVSTFFVCTQIDPSCNFDNETVAEIVDSSPDGMMLVYSNGQMEQIGFVDISDPLAPQPDGAVDVGGETTSVAVTPDGLFVVVGINTSPSFNDTSGLLVVVDMNESGSDGRSIRAALDVGGQPDSVAVSPDNSYIAVVIENERDEDLGDGSPPQAPAGFLVVIDKTDVENPGNWTTRTVNLTGLDGVWFPTDPELEYVVINQNNIAVITLQENNALVLVDLTTASVVASFTAGSVATLEQVDTVEDMDILLTDTLTDIPREPDAVTWLNNNDFFATADEGDLDGGSRGFTIYRASDGQVVYESGNLVEHLTVRFGHYPDERSENKGNEPEGITFDTFGEESMLFLLSERGSVVLVFALVAPDSDPSQVEFKQVLPPGAGPEGVKCIPSRNLLVVASEIDDRATKLRSSIAIYHYEADAPSYPTLMSVDRADGTPIPFSALSGLASADAPGLPETARRRLDGHASLLYTVEDSFFASTRILAIDVETFPYMVVDEIAIVDTNDVLSAVAPAGVVNDDEDKTVNIDAEGIAVSSMGGFWICHEGLGTVDDPERPVVTPNMLLKVTNEGVIEEVVLLPDDVNAMQFRFGLEGVAEQEEHVVAIFQRAWGNETNPRLGIYNTANMTRTFLFYPLDAPESQNGGWVGAGDIASLGEGRFLVLERDNQAGPDAVIKRVYSIDLGDLDSLQNGSTVDKSLVRDLVPDLLVPGGSVYEKMEGLAVNKKGEVWVNNDNDGVDGNSGEQQLIGLGMIVDTGVGSTTAAGAKRNFGLYVLLGLAVVAVFAVAMSMGRSQENQASSTEK